MPDAGGARFGWCAPLQRVDEVAKAGYDYIELPLAAQGLEDGTWQANLAMIRAAPLPALAFNYFFPRDLRIVDPGVDRRRLNTYVARAAELMAGVGATACVMGSAWARNVPEGGDRAQATAQIEDALRLIADRLQGTGVTCVIEPLYAKESNIINSVAEGAAVARRVDRPAVRVLADFFHMDEEREPLETLVENRDWLAHVHLADTGRKNPGTGSYPYARFFGLLKTAGYRGLMSAECSVDDPARGMAESLRFLRQHWAAAVAA